MSHKDYNLEIVGLLLRGPNHVRGIAQALGTNQTTIARKTAQLRKENVLDFKIEGKNKTFFLAVFKNLSFFIFPSAQDDIVGAKKPKYKV